MTRKTGPMTTARKRRTPEGGVLRACLDLLAAERIWHCRMNTGAVKDGNRFFRFGRKGMADILAAPIRKHHCMDHGLETLPKLVWIECKSERGVLSDFQSAFCGEVQTEGHIYLVIRDVSELQKWLKENREREEPRDA